ncbi:MAG: hypothetical protein IK104_02775 [Clostridia bacterium]|nr:hypothetical protein [Clostridia bacterium]
MKKILALLLTLALLTSALAGCGGEKPEPTDEPSSEGGAVTEELRVSVDDYANGYVTDDNNRVFYEIFVGSFSDSDGDGVGDLKGILSRMDYLNDGDPASGKSLGVEGLWLTPVFASPSYHKYDVTDYYKIDPKFGTTDDLKTLIDACHARGVKLILDLPINHTGRLNAWFSAFVTARRSGNESDPYYDFYVAVDKNGPFPTGRSFTPIAGTDVCYESNFSEDMPELNFDSENVRQAVLDVAKYYLDLGVDGFRFDAAKYVYFGDNAVSEDFWDWYMKELRKIDPDVYAVAEVWDSDGITDIYFPSVNCFDFTVSGASGLISETAKGGNVNTYTSYVQRYIKKVSAMRDSALYTPFISNHDMDRAAGFLNVAGGNMKVAANLLILGPGSPFIYYGEELGMRGSRGGANTDANRRLAMLWGDGDTVKDPEGTTYGADKQIEDTALTQAADENSLLTYYKKVIAIREMNPEIARGQYQALSFSGTNVGGFISEWNGKTVCVLHNTLKTSITVDLKNATDKTFTTLAAVIGTDGTATLNGTSVTIGAQTSVVLR